MRLALISSVALGLLAAASAHAQSNVTIYGIVDVGVGYVHNVKDSSGLNQNSLVKFGGALSGSRLGFKGTEDLGGGLSAIFQLENGFKPGTGGLGQGGRLFGRTSVAGLSSSHWGAFKLGRQVDPVVDIVQPLTQDNHFSGTFATPGDVDNYDNDLRVNNSIKYISPDFSGMRFEAMYGLGEAPGNTGTGQTYSVAAGYTNGPLGLGAGYFYTDGGATLGANGVRTWTGSSDSLFISVVNQGFASAKAIRIAQLGGNYEIGPVLFGAAYSNSLYRRDALSAYPVDAKFDSGSVYVNYHISAPLLVGVGYIHTKLSGPASAHYNQINVGAKYSLSTRTDLYVVAGYQKADGTTLNASGNVIQAQASIGSYGVNSGTDTQALTVVGLRHKF